jgi:YebC/PmpR family DNA-binding regulatory protein
MSGHSKWSKIKRQKGANDAKRGAQFTKLGNAIAVAAKAGKDPDMNPDLTMAIDKAKDANMPNANIDKAVKRGAGELGGDIIEEITYEGYGPGGVAIIIECASDNRNRTSADVRTAFSKNGGNQAETGAVAYQYERKGVIEVQKTGDDDADQLAAIEAGADDIIDDDDIWTIQTDMKQLHPVRKALVDAGLKIDSATLAYVPNNVVEISDEQTQEKVIKLMDVLDELDDVTETYTNFEIAD